MPHYIQFSRSGIVEGFSNTSEFQKDFQFVDFSPVTFQEVWENPKPALEQETGFIFFPPSQTRSVSGYFSMPTSIADGGSFAPVVRYVKTTGSPGDVAWQLEARVIYLGESVDVGFESLGIAQPSRYQHDDTKDKYSESNWGERKYVDQPGRSALGATVIYRLSRVHDDPYDTYNDMVKMIALGGYFEVDTLGSELKYEK